MDDPHQLVSMATYTLTDQLDVCALSHNPMSLMPFDFFSGGEGGWLCLLSLLEFSNVNKKFVH